MSLAATTAASASSDPSGIGLPANLPRIVVNATYYARALKSSDWVKTPNGLFDKSCVLHIPNGGSLDEATNTVYTKSGVARHSAGCHYPTLLPPGSGSPLAAVHPNSNSSCLPGNPVSSWLIYANYCSPIYETKLSTTYSVPNYPRTRDAEYPSYVFSSLESADYKSILQPVVGYGTTTGNNGGLAGGDELWMAPVYVYYSQVAGYNLTAMGTLYKVSYLDTITSTVQSSGCGLNGVNCTWTITMKDTPASGATTFSSSKAFGSSPAYTNAQGGVLESEAPHCPYLFANGHAVFRNINVQNGDGSTDIDWYVKNEGQCSMTYDQGATSLDFLWSDS